MYSSARNFATRYHSGVIQKSLQYAGIVAIWRAMACATIQYTDYYTIYRQIRPGGHLSNRTILLTISLTGQFLFWVIHLTGQLENWTVLVR